MDGALWLAIGALLLCTLAAAIFYMTTRFYEARYDRTYMTHNERGFKRALSGKVVLWDFEEAVVKGSVAPPIEFVAVDPVTGGRRMERLLDARTGAIDLRPRFAAPLPFEAVTADGRKILIDARVQFSIDREQLKQVYEINEFAQALDTRIQHAFRTHVGKNDLINLRSGQAWLDRSVLQTLRYDEEEARGDSAERPALGVRFHAVSFDLTDPQLSTVLGGETSALTVTDMEGVTRSIVDPELEQRRLRAVAGAVKRAEKDAGQRKTGQIVDDYLRLPQGQRSVGNGVLDSLARTYLTDSDADAQGADPQLVRQTSSQLRRIFDSELAGAYFEPWLPLNDSNPFARLWVRTRRVGVLGFLLTVFLGFGIGVILSNPGLVLDALAPTAYAQTLNDGASASQLARFAVLGMVLLIISGAFVWSMFAAMSRNARVAAMGVKVMSQVLTFSVGVVSGAAA